MRFRSAIISVMAYGRRNRRKKSRQRTGFYIFAALVVLAVGALAYVGGSSIVDTTLRSDVDSVQRADDPTGAEAPEPVSDEAAGEAIDKAAKETAEAQNSDDPKEAEEAEAAQEEAALLAEEEAPLEEELPTEEGLSEEEEIVPPDDPTMYLSVPKLGISGAIVAGGEAGLELGAQLVSGAPWVQGSNTYIAGHRVGFPGTGSDRIFYDLPSMAAGDTVTLYDSLGQEYTYQVSEVFAVTPYDVWVTAPTGSDMVTLQVCTETPDDWTTIGPRLMSSGPESGRLIVRAVRV
jgi:sortase A